MIQALTCSEQTIDVHGLLLSISPYSSHGLETHRKETFEEKERDVKMAPSAGQACYVHDVIIQP